MYFSPKTLPAKATGRHRTIGSEPMSILNSPVQRGSPHSDSLRRRRFRSMRVIRTCWSLVGIIFLLLHLAAPSAAQAQEKLLISYGGHNETVGPMWVAVDKGLFKKYGLDVNMLQV